LHAVLNAYGLNNDDEVIVPSFTFIATSNSPLFVGSKPIFADIEEETYGLNPESVREQITPKTKAILPVHYGGCPCLIKQLREIADEHNILLIEDVAESFGATVEGKKAGSFGDSSVLSFCQNKVISTGEGGAVVTDSKELYEKMKLFRSHGRLEDKDYFSSIEYMDYISLGYNFRMSNITAALGLSQLRKVDQIIRMRQENGAYLTRRLAKIKQVNVMHAPDGFSHVYQLYTIRVNEEQRDPLMQFLASKGIMTKVYFAPIHLTRFYKNVLKYNCNLAVTGKI
jgi:perosamine synthetase